MPQKKKNLRTGEMWNVQFPADVRPAIEPYAQAEHRSAANMVRRIIADWLDAQAETETENS